MDLVVNGAAYRHHGQGSLAELLQEYAAEPGRTAVMVNGEVVRKSRFDTTKLSEGDQVELLMFAGGG